MPYSVPAATMEGVDEATPPVRMLVGPATMVPSVAILAQPMALPLSAHATPNAFPSQAMAVSPSCDVSTVRLPVMFDTGLHSRSGRESSGPLASAPPSNVARKQARIGRAPKRRREVMTPPGWDVG